MTDVLQTSLPYDPFTPKPLPGIAPLAMQDWLIVDEAYAGQMALRRALVNGQRDVVLALDGAALAAAVELMDLVVDQLVARAQGDFSRSGYNLTCPDGAVVRIDRNDPLATLGQVAQEDFCILQKQGDEHVLTGAVLCFPASWQLSEKFMRPLVGIHIPVQSYTDEIAKRVQRLFDGVRDGRPLWRFNALWYDHPEIHTPRSEKNRRNVPDAETGAYLRSEKQSILRLPNSNAVVFSIHTFVVARENLVAD